MRPPTAGMNRRSRVSSRVRSQICFDAAKASRTAGRTGLGNMFTASLDITWPTRPGILTPPRCLVREMPSAVAEKLRAAQRNRTRQSSERTKALSATAGLVTSHQLPARQGDAGQDLIGATGYGDVRCRVSCSVTLTTARAPQCTRWCPLLLAHHQHACQR